MKLKKKFILERSSKQLEELYNSELLIENPSILRTLLILTFHFWTEAKMQYKYLYKQIAYLDRIINLTTIKWTKKEIQWTIYASINYAIFLECWNFRLNLKTNFKLRLCRGRDLFGSQIPVIAGGFELRISCIRTSNLTHETNFKYISNFQTFYWVLVEQRINKKQEW